METAPFAFADVKLIKLMKFSDVRGFFCETFTERRHPGVRFIQDNLSLSATQGTVRGLHFQTPPFAQAKLLTVLQGALFDVVVDLRRGSPGFGRWSAYELAADADQQLFIPAGYAHGICTLAPDTLISYKVDAYYAADCDRGIRWDDPALGIPWPVTGAAATLSDKDRCLPLFAEIQSPFTYEPPADATERAGRVGAA